MAFNRILKIGIRKTLARLFVFSAIVFATAIPVINSVFAFTGLNVPVEIVWDDDNPSARPAQVILHLRETGTQTDIATATVTDANQDPNNPNKWTYVFTDVNYNSGTSYEVYQEIASGYTNDGPTALTMTNAPTVSNFITAPSEYLGTGSHTVGGIDFALSKYDGKYYLFTRTASAYTGTDYDTLISSLSNQLGHSITIDGYVYKNVGNSVGGDAKISYMRLGQESQTLRVLATQQELYYGTLSTSTATKATITNTLAPARHTVTYEFTGDVLPPNAGQLLPAATEYDDGNTVTVAQNPTATGYRFLGWKINGQDAGTSFTMPSNDITITGSWEQFSGTFAPTISKQIVNPQTIYRYGDTVEFLVTVSNPESYPIHNIEVEEQLLGAKFLTNSAYTVNATDNSKAIIPTIPAGGTVVLYAEYDISDDVTQTRTNTAEITAASADNYYFLDTTQDYTASVQFATQSWQDVPVLTGVNTNSTTLYYALMVLGIIGITGGVVISQKTNKEREK